MVLVQQFLVGRVLEVALRDGVHIVEAEILLLGGQETVLIRTFRHDVRQLESVHHVPDVPAAGDQ